jgi:hypothetical protein
MNLIIIFIFIFLGFASKNWFSYKFDSNDKKTLSYLWVFHLFIAIVFYLYVNANGGDARNYWFTVKYFVNKYLTDYLAQGLGTNFMYVINYFPSKILGLSFLAGSIIYAFLGYLAFIFYYILFKKYIRYNFKFFGIYVFPAILFLPNLHFWTAGVGKDTLLFFCISLFFYGILDYKKNLGKILFALVLSYFVRPHITLFLIFSTGLALIFSGKLKLYQKIFFFIIFAAIVAVLINPLIAFLNLEELDSESVSNFSNTSVKNLSKDNTGSSVDISGYPLPLKIFTFLFRPLFFDASGILGLVASLENLILFILTFKFFKLNPYKMFKRGTMLFKNMMLFLIMGSISFSLILGNLGIMLRQKNMFMPSLIFIILWSVSYAHERKLKAQKAFT